MKVRFFLRIIKQEIKDMLNNIRFRLTRKTDRVFAMTTVTDFDKPEMYIGNVKHALFLLKKGIRLETLEAPNGKVACIGYSPKEQKWYGWSHRAIYGFGVGSTCEPGNCHYSPSNKEEFLEYLKSMDSASHKTTYKVFKTGVKEISKFLGCVDDPSQDEFIGTVNTTFHKYPQVWGKGTWTAKTIDEAKQMAIDFAESVG